MDYNPVGSQTQVKCILIDESDNVAVAPVDIAPGTSCEAGERVIHAIQDIPKGHKIALSAIEPGKSIIKYGYPIGSATTQISAGEYVHSHNIKTNLTGALEYTYNPTVASPPTYEHVPVDLPSSFRGYRRAGDCVAIRNEVWIIPTTGCVNGLAERLARQTSVNLPRGNIDGVFALTHPYGCNQLGDDHVRTQEILANLAHHPHAAAVLVVSLGCETNNLQEFKKVLGTWDPRRVKFLVCQDEEDEYSAGLSILTSLLEFTSQAERVELPISELRIGLTCGGSDAFSGITANPVVGSFSDMFIGTGGSAVLTEVPEMFGAEIELLNRCMDGRIFAKGVDMINSFKRYFLDRGHPVHENPAPGNIEGGITTLEEKSLGCTKKAGNAAVVDVLPYTGRVQARGLTLLSAPGNDLVCTTALAAAGCHLLLFTTGRGNPLGSVIPTIKIATTTELAKKKRSWIDFNAGTVLGGAPIRDLATQLFSLVGEVASGERTRNEENGYRDMTILKDGVTV